MLPRLRTLILASLLVSRCWLVGAEKAYPLGCAGRDPSFYDYERYPFPPKDPLVLKVAAATEICGLPLIRTPDEFLILKRLGTGKFSDVFEGVDLGRSGNEHDLSQGQGKSGIVVLKCLKPVSERKIRREVLVLQHVSRLPNLARILGVVLPTKQQYWNQTVGSNDGTDQLPRMPTLVLGHAGHESQWLCHNGRAGGSRGMASYAATTGKTSGIEEQSQNDLLTQFEVRFYLFHLLVALDSMHACGIMHRDVKPRNVLIHREEKKLMLIDLGLADFYLPNQRYNVRVASRHYKSPELLLGFDWYDYAIDMWGVGCILAGLLFRREPLFRGRDNLDQLGKIIARLGTSDLINYALRYNMQLSNDVQGIISQFHARGALHRRPWIDLLSTDTSTPVLDEFQLQGVDLVDRLLVYDHDQRWTARQAMQHVFFNTVRDDVLRQVQTTPAHSSP